VQQVAILQKVFAKIRRLENYINLDYFGTNKSGIKKKDGLDGFIFGMNI
jgi:hypothetical protein